MASIWAELKRRSVVKVAVAYAIVGWLLAQLAEFATETFGAPAWVLQIFVVFLVLGLPPAMILAWAYEMTPEGFRASSKVQSADSLTHLASQRLNYTILALIALVVVFLVVDRFVLESPVSSPPLATASPSSNDDASPSRVLRFITTLNSEGGVTDTGLGAHVALSPDGGALVYAAEAEGVSQLFYRTLNQLEARPLPGTEDAEEPFFSPDGNWVAFFDETDRELKKIAVHGGPPQSLTSISTSAGGSWVAEDFIVYSTQGTDGIRSLFRVPSTGGMSERLVEPAPETGHVRPAVLPGGNAVLFATRPGAGGGGNAREGGIGVLSLETGEFRRIINGGYEPKYAPTGHIVFARSDALWAVPFDVGRLETVGPEVPVVHGVDQDGFRGGAAYSFSDSGMLVYVPGGDTSGASDRNLVWLDRQGNERLAIDEVRFFWNMALSPNGEHLAIRIAERGNSDIWVYALVNGMSNRLTFDQSTEWGPAWTGDGNGVVFGSDREGGGIFWKAADGTGQVEPLITGNTSLWPHTFSSDGRLIFDQLTGARGSDLFIFTPESGRAVQPLLEFQGDQFAATVSPDGRWLAYTSTESSRPEVYVGRFPDIEEGGKWQVSRTGGSEPRWRSDGRELFFRSERGVMAASVETDPGGSTFSTNTPRLLFPTDQYIDNFQTYAVSPDGQRFLFLKEAEVENSQTSAQTQLVVVMNWFDELNRLARATE